MIGFITTYRAQSFDPAAAPSVRMPFRVLFAGRIERYKGVFDLLEIARRLFAAGKTHIEFDLCGNGSSVEKLKEDVAAAGLSDRFRLHGHQSRPQMREMYRQAHVLIVPTTTDFIEGFNQVVVEGVLAGRPVITSTVCPAVEYVREAIVEVPPDDVTAYHDAILRLCEDRALYEQKQSACADLQRHFYDLDRSWAAALRAALAATAISGRKN